MQSGLLPPSVFWNNSRTVRVGWGRVESACWPSWPVSLPSGAPALGVGAAS